MRMICLKINIPIYVIPLQCGSKNVLQVCRVGHAVGSSDDLESPNMPVWVASVVEHGILYLWQLGMTVMTAQTL